MPPIDFDAIAKLLAAHRLSRRRALARGGVGLAALGFAAGGGGVAPTAAQDDHAPDAAAAEPDGFTVLAEPALGATAVATPTTIGAKPLTFLFLQSFARGSLVPKPGVPGHYLLTLTQGLGDTVYFSDRPAKVVGTVPTERFLDALGFTPANPPNAALIGQRDATHKDVVVLELLNPHYDAAANTLTYEVTLLADWHKLEETFPQTPDDEAHLPRDFTAAHLFIDDCPDATPLNCYPDCSSDPVGNLGYQGMCWNWSAFQCQPCDGGWGGTAAHCNQTYAACGGHCFTDRSGTCGTGP